MKRNRCFFSSETGIATFELLALVVLLAVVIILAFPLFIARGFEEKIEDTKAQIVILNVILEQYKKDHPEKRYPVSEELAPIGEVPGLVGTYLGRVPDSPFDTPYLYQSDGNEYQILVSLRGGADVRPGGGNDNLRYDSKTEQITFF